MDRLLGSRLAVACPDVSKAVGRICIGRRKINVSHERERWMKRCSTTNRRDHRSWISW
jgi:hypothetical protein